MSDKDKLLQQIIEDFSKDKLVQFYKLSSDKFRPISQDYSHYLPEKDSRFQNIKQIGEIEYPKQAKTIAFFVCPVSGELSEKDSKKKQYDVGKKILKDNYRDAGIFVFHGDNNFRLSLIAASYSGPKREFTTFKRYTYFVSPDLTNKTFKDQLKKCDFSSIETILEAFSIEAVNKEFYTQIARKFTDLVGGWLKIGNRKYEREGCLVWPGSSDEKRKEFAVRLIGRMVFCWFLKKKHSEPDNIPLIPKNILSLDAANNNDSYYHFVLEPLFFQVLNKKINDRHKKYRTDGWDKIPFLNGGLFTPHSDDYYNPDDFQGISPRGDVKVPDEWLRELLEIFERYNFTIDENTPVDIEISIDPEMLGRIFENLLAMINPETGETARKSTGSYYTPRPIVEYMVDQSIKQYLLTQTNILEENIDSLLSYSDEAINANLTDKQNDCVIEALDTLKVLDPACGSGAFPIGILQKILLILQKVDPDSVKWKTRLLAKIPNTAARKTLAEKLESETWQYIHKLGVIQNSIYGVDIQPIATEISKLRIFLSLIVDETVNDDKDNRGIEPLPNLKFKFVCGNSLVDMFFGRTIDVDTVQTKSKTIIERLTSLKADFFSAVNEKEKVEYNLKFLQGKLELANQLLADLKDKNQFTDILFGDESLTKKQKKEKKEAIIKKAQAELLNKAVENARTDIDDLIAKSHVELAEVEQLEAKHFTESFIWKLDFAEIFTENDGFDIIIANPPYVGEKGHKEIFRDIKKGSLAKFCQMRMDLFYFFFHLAINIGRQHAIIAFITTNYFTTATGARKLRHDIKNRTNIIHLVNFNELKIFESALGQHNMITILEKENNESTIAQTCINQKQSIARPEILQQILSGNDNETHYYKVAQNNLYEGNENYIRLEGTGVVGNVTIHTILDRMKEQSSFLGNICNLDSGIQTGVDKVTNNHIKKGLIESNYLHKGVFVLSKDELSSLAITESEQHIIKPWYKNSDIKKYYTKQETNEYLIYATRDLNINDYPNIYEHFKVYEKVIKNRSPNRGEIQAALKLGKWWVLFVAKRKEIFQSKKIICPQRSDINCFAYHEGEFFSSKDVYYITTKERGINLKYLLSLLNSSLIFHWLYHKGKRKGRSLELYYKPLSEIPIKRISTAEQKPFIELVDSILAITKSEDYLENSTEQDKVKELEKQIDQMVYELYGLTKEEIEIIENSLKV